MLFSPWRFLCCCNLGGVGSHACWQDLMCKTCVCRNLADTDWLSAKILDTFWMLQWKSDDAMDDQHVWSNSWASLHTHVHTHVHVCISKHLHLIRIMWLQRTGTENVIECDITPSHNWLLGKVSMHHHHWYTNLSLRRFVISLSGCIVLHQSIGQGCWLLAKAILWQLHLNKADSEAG